MSFPPVFNADGDLVIPSEYEGVIPDGTVVVVRGTMRMWAQSLFSQPLQSLTSISQGIISFQLENFVAAPTKLCSNGCRLLEGRWILGMLVPESAPLTLSQAPPSRVPPSRSFLVLVPPDLNPLMRIKLWLASTLDQQWYTLKNDMFSYLLVYMYYLVSKNVFKICTLVAVNK